MLSKKERNQYDLKEKYKTSKNSMKGWCHNVLTVMFTITEKSALLYKKFKFSTSPNPSRHHVLRINCAWYNLKSRDRLFFLKKCIVL